MKITMDDFSSLFHLPLLGNFFTPQLMSVELATINMVVKLADRLVNSY